MRAPLKDIPKATFSLFIDPNGLNTSSEWLQIIQIKKGRFLDFEFSSLNKANLKKVEHVISKQAVGSIQALLSESIKHSIKNFTAQYTAQKTNGSLEQYIAKHLIKYYIQSIEEFIYYSTEFKSYHRVINPQTGNIMMAPCQFSKYKPGFVFEVIKSESGLLMIERFCYLDGERFPLHELNIFEFLIQHQNRYYAMSLRDYTILKWLQDIDYNKYKGDVVLFNEQVVKKMEQQNFEVNYNGHLESKVVEVEPTYGILLSEINSGDFLMITPQFKYGEVKIEGVYSETHRSYADGEMVVIIRNKELESSFVEEIRTYHPNFKQQINGYFFLNYADAEKKNWFLNFYFQMIDKGVELAGLDLLKHFKYSSSKVVTKIEQISELDNWVRFKMICSFGDEQINMKEIQKTLWRGETHIMLKDGSLGIFDDVWCDQYAQMIKQARIDDDVISIPKWLLIAEGDAIQFQPLRFVIDSNWWNRWKQWQDVKVETYAVSTTLKANLRPYQQKGFEWLKLMSEVGAGACLADDMGLGKTLQTIAFIASCIDKNELGLTLIVCPASLTYNWKSEFEKFLPSVKVYVHHGSNRNFNNLNIQNANICIMPYSTMRNDIELVKNVVWETVVLDESHYIKSTQALTTKAAYQLVSKNKIALSGTPIINNTFDLYAQLNFLLPNYLGNQEFFKREYSNPIDREKNKQRIQDLQKITQPFVLRRTKDQVATDLPEKTVMTMWCEMSHEQEQAYEKLKSSIKASVFLEIKNNGLAKSKLSVLQGIVKLRQLCCSPALLPNEDLNTDASIKVDLLIDELINNLSNNKVLVFSQFKGMLHLIAERLNQNGIEFYHFDGDVDVKERMELVDKFQEEGNAVRIFLMTIKTGNAGITLTAADYVFLVDPWWNSAIERQAIDRTHRIGQTKNVFAYRMICKNTIEERILEIQNRKEFISDELISEEDGFVKNLTENDLAFLFD